MTLENKSPTTCLKTFKYPNNGNYISIEKLDLQTPDLVNANFEKLTEIFLNCVTENVEIKLQERNYHYFDGI